MMISDGDNIILKKDAFMRVVQARKNGRPIILDKMKFYLDNIFGKPYGSQFEVDKKSSQLVERKEDFSVEDYVPEASSGADNRNLISANEDNQSLGQVEIQALRKDGLSGEEVMTELIKNSSTFNQKTKFSQEKWIKKKKKKHMAVYTILKPCTRLIAELYYLRDASKICFLRMDSLAQILTMSNIHACSSVLLVESCQGLLAGAILDRLGDSGCLTQLFTGPNPMKGRNAFDDFGFSKALMKNRMKLYPLNLLHELTCFAKHRKMEQKVEPETNLEPTAKRSKPNSCVAETVPTLSESANDEMVERSHMNDEEESVPMLSQTTTDAIVPESETPMECSLKDVGESRTVDSNHVVQENSSSTDGHLSSTPVTTQDEERSSLEERQLPVYLQERNLAKEYIECNKFDTLIVAVKSHPTQLVLHLLSLVKLSRPIVVFHQHKEPLMELFVQLKERGGMVNLKLSETWYRNIQVLPERTHPTVNMSGTSGYILTGTTVVR